MLNVEWKFFFIPMSENELFWKNPLVFFGFFWVFLGCKLILWARLVHALSRSFGSGRVLSLTLSFGLGWVLTFAKPSGYFGSRPWRVCNFWAGLGWFFSGFLQNLIPTKKLNLHAGQNDFQTVRIHQDIWDLTMYKFIW